MFSPRGVAASCFPPMNMLNLSQYGGLWLTQEDVEAGRLPWVWNQYGTTQWTLG